MFIYWSLDLYALKVKFLVNFDKLDIGWKMNKAITKFIYIEASFLLLPWALKNSGPALRIRLRRWQELVVDVVN